MRKDRFEIVQGLIQSGKIKVDIEHGLIYLKWRNIEYRPAKLGRSLQYPAFFISINGHQWCFPVHQIVMVAAGEDVVEREINHIDGNKHNNRYDNLEITTRSENVRHAYRMYRKKLGIPGC